MVGGIFEKRFDEILELLQGFPREPSLGQSMAVLVGPARERILALCEQASRQLNQPGKRKHLTPVLDALLFGVGAPLRPWVAKEAIAAIQKQISKWEQLRRHDLAMHLVRALAVLEARENGETWENAYVVAANALAKTGARAKSETMGKSYQLVQRQIKDGKGAQFRIWIDLICQSGLSVLKQADIFPGLPKEPIRRRRKRRRLRR